MVGYTFLEGLQFLKILRNRPIQLTLLWNANALVTRGKEVEWLTNLLLQDLQALLNKTSIG